MNVFEEIRSRPWIMILIIAVAMLAFLINPETLTNMNAKDPNTLGEVNGQAISSKDYDILLQQQTQGGQPMDREQAWQAMVNYTLLSEEFDDAKLLLTDDMFWAQFGSKKEIEDQAKSNPQIQQFLTELPQRRGLIEMQMKSQIYQNLLSAGIFTNDLQVKQIQKFQSEVANIDYVKVNYDAYNKKVKYKVTDEDLENFIKKHPTRFKVGASRSFHYTYFPGEPSAKDDSAALNTMRGYLTGKIMKNESTGRVDTIQSFASTKNDSLYLMTYSEIPYNTQYSSANQLPENIQSWVTTAPVGSTYGPYKYQNYYMISKLTGKAPSDSTLAKVIVISSKDANPQSKLSKEQAKKLADSIAGMVRTNPNSFASLAMQYSDDPNTKAKGGEIGWLTLNTIPPDPAIKSFIQGSSAGQVAVLPNQIGYLVMQAADKKTGSMGYNVNHLGKQIRASEETLNKTQKHSQDFASKVEGHNLQHFVKVAREGNIKNRNVKGISRFASSIPGLGTNKDGDILNWAFNPDREIADNEMFETDTGGYIMVYLTGIYEAGLASPAIVRDQIETEVRNQILGEKIVAEINSGNYKSIDAIASKYASPKATATVSMLNPTIPGAGSEPKVVGAAFGLKKGTLSKAIQGTAGVYVIKSNGITKSNQPAMDAKQIRPMLSQQNTQTAVNSILKGLYDAANIKDWRADILQY